MTVIGLDDELPALRILESYCAENNCIDSFKTFSNPKEALQHLRTYPVDVLFLDINMPTISGLDFYEKVKSEVLVIFTTAHKEFAHQAFDLNAIDYLLKPFSYERFCRALEKIKHQKAAKIATQPFINFRTDYRLKRFYINDILFIQAYDDYIKIFTNNDKVTVVRQTLKATMEKIPKGQFCQVHRSFIVSLPNISFVRNKTIFIGEVEVPIGKAYEEQFMKQYTDSGR